MKLKPEHRTVIAYVVAFVLLGAGLAATGWFPPGYEKLAFPIAALIIPVTVVVVLVLIDY
ncbi:hypothetical protein G4Y73_11135 [Wenzhouxiangella sp. XN201]|uniref:hypothetical protein n=1 Tax=Wenzhouxiangella sp. XN201 TaxID=2710755 RepID=UPI0013C80B06|nr:hypothetical protein [Wenzhouxiangella sp. XN201]NEZ04706.1 hypothetical protein [Wenzhouxiangella sp. XN201]